MNALKFFLMLVMLLLAMIGGFRLIVLPEVADQVEKLQAVYQAQELEELKKEKDRQEDFLRCLNIPSFSDGVKVEKMKIDLGKSVCNLYEKIREKELSLSKKSS